MRVLVLGAYGMLGHKLVEVLQGDFDVYATCRAPKSLPRPALPAERLLPGVTAENLDSVTAAFAAARPDAVVNCIGVIKQQRSAKDPIPSITINALFPHKLAVLCQATGARLIHFSTDCVFSGSKGHYTEADATDATDLYGRSKQMGEVSGPGCLTIRSSIIGPELENKLGLLEWFWSQAGKEVKGFRRAIYSGLTTLEMARLVAKLIREFPALDGLWQVAADPISKFDLLTQVNEIMQLGTTIVPEDNFYCDRSLDGTRFTRATGYRAPDWPTMLAEMARDAATVK